MKRPEVVQEGYWDGIAYWLPREMEPEGPIDSDEEAVVLTRAAFDAYCAEVEQRIAAAVLEEREAIAAMFDTDEATYGYECDNKMIAAAIRARGETK